MKRMNFPRRKLKRTLEAEERNAHTPESKRRRFRLKMVLDAQKS